MSSIIDPKPQAPVNGREREIAIEWRGDVPVVGHLTGADAKRVLAQVLVQARQLSAVVAGKERDRAQLAAFLVALVHRDAARGLVGVDGQPVLPMRTAIPRESCATFRERWAFHAEPLPDGSFEIVADRVVES